VLFYNFQKFSSAILTLTKILVYEKMRKTRYNICILVCSVWSTPILRVIMTVTADFAVKLFSSEHLCKHFKRVKHFSELVWRN